MSPDTAADIVADPAAAVRVAIPDAVAARAARPTLPSRWSRLRPWLLGGAGLAVALLAATAVHALSAQLSYAAVAAAFDDTPARALLLSALFAAFSYAAMLGYDLAALRHAAPGAAVPLRTAALASFCGFALSNSAGVGAFTGGAVRWRVYSAAGLPPAAVAGVIGFLAPAFGLGVVAAGALGLLAAAPEVAEWLDWPAGALRAAAAAALLAVAAIVALCARGRGVRLGRWVLRLPSWRLALGTLAASLLDLGFAALALWVLLPDGAAGFAVFLPVFAVAVAAALLSHVPGGLGVFEAVVLLAMRGAEAPLDGVAAALLLYRATYYALPLALALLLLAAPTLRRGATRGGRALRAASQLAPRFLGTMAFLAGAALLLGGVVPDGEGGPGALAEALPVPLFEASHLLSSVGGLALVFVADRLVHRIDAAWWLATALAAACLALALLRGGGAPELGALATLLLALLATRRRFDRRAALWAAPRTAGWLLAVLCVLGAAVWLLFFAHRDVAYAHELWWRFELDESAPRGMRAALGASVLFGGFGLWSLLGPAAARADRPDAEAVARAAAIGRDGDRADAGLVRLGDKSLLFSADGDAFVMFGRRGRSFVALFDPVGPAARRADLVWRFVELADAARGRAAFYQVRPEGLPLYLDAGLRPIKLGEAAHVPLAGFDLRGKSRANLRNAVNRAERAGLRFDVLEPEAVPAAMAELRAVSDLWLAAHAAREKSFSLGAFDPGYVAGGPVATVRDAAGALLAFATLLETPGSRAEASVDLMRHRPDAPGGTMDLLFVRLLLRARDAGYRRFDLGMAPLSGLAAHRLAPAWHRVGGLLFRRGERFYNFRGLRAFKEKFDPVWEPRYLLATGGLDPWVVLADVAALQSGGLRGVIGK